MGIEIQGLRPILKRRFKHNKNKEPTVPMKMETSGVPANRPA